MRRLSSSFSLVLCLLFSLSFANRIATIFASRLLQLHIFTLPYLLSLNSLDREGARLLSPCGSQITITPDGDAVLELAQRLLRLDVVDVLASRCLKVD